jgi:tricorn protease
VPGQPAYLRSPSIRHDTLAFVADDDVWLAPSTGGTARRLTADHVPAAGARLSPDGAHLAYTGRRDGRPEAYVVGTDGGAVSRVTYWGDLFTRVIGWADDERVIAVSAAGEPFRSRTWAYAVPIAGGTPERLPYGPISALSHGPGGAVVLGVNQSARRGAAWKRYRGGTAAALWIDPDGGGVFERFLGDMRGQLEDPAFVGTRVMFVSDHEGTGNVYSSSPDGSDVTRHTDHEGFYARAAASDGRRVVYQCAGAIFILDELVPESQPRLLEIHLGAPRSGRATRRLRTEDELGEFAPDHTGRASAVEVRGSLHWLTHRDGPARLLGGGGGSRARLARVIGGEHAQVAFVTDADGEDALEVAAVSGAPADGPRRIGAGLLGRVLDLAGAPDGSAVAVATHDGRVVLIDLASAELSTIDHSPHGDATGLNFSPDSAWLAWSHAGPEPLRHIKLARVDGSAQLDVTSLRFDDRDPVFTLDGRYLAFLSVRTFDPVYDEHVFDMSFLSAARPYLLTLASATLSPFDAEPEGRPPRSAAAREHDSAHERPASEPPRLVVDLEGLHERVVPFPVAAGRYSHLRAVAGGVVWMAEPALGVLGEERARPGAAKPRPKLVRYDLAKRLERVRIEALDAFQVSGDGRFLVVRDDKKLRVVPAERAPEKLVSVDEPDPDDAVDVDLTRVRVELAPPLEWRQMYEESARLMRDHYWIEDMAGVDWQEIVARYRPLLGRVATRDDLSELIWEVSGELGSSHAYETPPERPVEAERRLGLLGADVVRDAEGEWSVGRILPGETSVPMARSPLSAPGVVMRAGDVFVAVDGTPVDPALGPPALLVGAAGKPVELAIRHAGETDIHRFVVQPLDDERPLRYQDWVAGRRAAVHAATEGRVGYLHIPDMMGNGWAQLHRDLRLEVAKEALIVDVRDNGGGHVSELVLEKLARTVSAWSTARHQQPATYPLDSPRGPLVAVTNEQAGSDGDIVTAGFRLRRLGPVVGTRTWGGVIGIDMRYKLVDGTSVTQPRYAFWFYGLEWGVENYGVDPDVEVPFPPQDWAAGTDPQLDKAIEMVLEALQANPAARPPDPATRPSRAAPALPPRLRAGEGE